MSTCARSSAGPPIWRCSEPVTHDGIDRTIERLLRELAPQVLSAVVRRYGHFDLAEDATQEALLAAATQWPRDGVPDQPPRLRTSSTRETRRNSYPSRGSPDWRYYRGSPHRPLVGMPGATTE